MKKSKLAEIVILRDYRKAVALGVLPYPMVRLPSEARRINVLASRKSRVQIIDEPWAQILVEEQLHAAGGTASRRSRAAANARQARMSSRVRLGKSARIWSSAIPPAKYSRTSYTVIRVPRTQGLPLRTPGAIVIRSSRFITAPYAPNAPCYPGLFRPPPLLPQESSRVSASGQGRAAQKRTPGGPGRLPSVPRAGSRPPRVAGAGAPTADSNPGQATGGSGSCRLYVPPSPSWDRAQKKTPGGPGGPRGVWAACPPLAGRLRSEEAEADVGGHIVEGADVAVGQALDDRIPAAVEEQAVPGRAIAKRPRAPRRHLAAGGQAACMRKPEVPQRPPPKRLRKESGPGCCPGGSS